MGKVPEPHRITIVVRRGIVENVSTTLPMDIEVDILDFDGIVHSREEIEDMNAYLEQIKKEQRELWEA